MKKIILAAAMLLIMASSANAGFVTGVVVGSAMSSSSGNTKEPTAVVHVPGRSVMCPMSDKNGYCKVSLSDGDTWSRAQAYYKKECPEGYYHCGLTPDKYVAAYTGVRYPVKSITYTYLGATVAIIEY